jgi:arabinose-5-phosphate isomerase
MIPNEVLFREAYAILQAAKTITNELDTVINLIVENVRSQRYIILTGIGKNASIAQKVSSTYSSIGIPSFYLDGFSALHGDLGMIVKNQLIIGFSKSGNTKELTQTFDACGTKGAMLVSITTNHNSTLGYMATKYNGINIVLPFDNEADEHGLAPTSSSTLFIAIGDAIGCTASSKLNFTKEQFLSNHPNGSLGEKLKKDLNKE